MLWKTSCLVPVPKTPQSSGFSDYRPVALTSHIMKTLVQLMPMVRPPLDPLQFTYQPRIGVEDAIIYLLNHVYAHLDRPGSTVGITFFDFSSAFNSIRPALLGDKLMAMLVNPPLVSWVGDYLTGRPQYTLAALCQMHWSATLGPHKKLSSLLSSSPFTPQTSATRQRPSPGIFGDPAVVGFISKAEYRAVVDNFVTWCELNHMQLNTTKTKEPVVNLSRTRTPVTPVTILGHNIDIVEHYKHLRRNRAASIF